MRPKDHVLALLRTRLDHPLVHRGYSEHRVERLTRLWHQRAVFLLAFYRRVWRKDGTRQRIHATVQAALRRRGGRHKHATAGCLDSQRVKTSAGPDHPRASLRLPGMRIGSRATETLLTHRARSSLPQTRHPHDSISLPDPDWIFHHHFLYIS